MFEAVWIFLFVYKEETRPVDNFVHAANYFPMGN